MFSASVNTRHFERAAWWQARVVICGVALSAVLGVCAARGGDAGDSAEIAQRLIAGYPGIVKGVEGNAVVFNDGTTLPLDDGTGEKSFDAWLAKPDIQDMFRLAYPVGTIAAAPSRDVDPGRARNAAFFAKVYGDCRQHQVAGKLITIPWLPKKYGRLIKVTPINGVAKKLRAISDDLDKLPARFNRFLFPIGGTYACRVIAGTDQASAHSYGIAIDIAVKPAHYWRWPKLPAGSDIPYRNAIPMEIIDAFEKHGFIWGGRWYHHDTMHFEYRPELFPMRSHAVK